MEPSSTPRPMPMNTGSICTCCSFCCTLPTTQVTASMASSRPTRLRMSPNCRLVWLVGTSSIPARLRREITTSYFCLMSRSRIFLPSTCSLVTTTRSTRRSVPRVESEVSTSPPAPAHLAQGVPLTTRCSRSPSSMRESGRGTISSSPRLRREQMTSASSRLGSRSASDRGCWGCAPRC